MKRHLGTLLLVLVPLCLLSQFQKGDWLLSSDFYYVETELKRTVPSFENQSDQVINWEFKGGSFLHKNIFFGGNFLFQYEMKALETPLFSLRDSKKFTRFAPFLRIYAYKIFKKSPVFLEFEWATEKGKTEENQRIRTSWVNRTNLGLGVSFTKIKSLNLELFMQYSITENIKERFSFTSNYIPANFRFSFKWFTHLSKDFLNSKTHYFPNNFEKGTQFIQFDFDLHSLIELHVGYGIFPADRWALGINSSIYFFLEWHYESRFFTRYYLQVGPQIQFFGHLAGMYQQQDRIFGIMSINDARPRFATIFYGGIGMNILLNKHVGIEWVYGPFFHKNIDAQKGSGGLILESKINYFF